MEGEIMILLFLTRLQSIPPFAKDLTDSAVVVVRVALVHEATMSLAEDHERIHRSTDVVTIVALEARHAYD